MTDSSSISLTERRIEFGFGVLLGLYSIRAAAPIFGATLLAIIVVWLALVLSLAPRRRKSFRFDQRLLVVLIVVGLLWITFGLALATGERSEDPSILPTLVAMGAEKMLNSQTVMADGVLSVVAIGATIDGFRHALRRRKGRRKASRRPPALSTSSGEAEILPTTSDVSQDGRTHHPA